MAAIPANFGGDREFLPDPDRAGTAAALGDMAAINLQLLHVLQPVFAADGLEAERTRLAGILRNTLQAADAFKARENSTREVRPMNNIPAVDFGATNNLAGIRINQLPQFDGLSNDPKVVIRWISRVLRTAEAHTLTRAATINLMVHASSGPASDFIDQMREEGRGIGDIIRNLELRYGGLVQPEEALVKVNTMLRDEGENLHSFLDRLRHMAKMAKRDIVDNAQRSAAIDTLVESNIRRVLPKSVLRALEERILARQRMGQPNFSAMDLEKECIELEQRRNDTRVEVQRAQSRIMGKPHKKIHAVVQPKQIHKVVTQAGTSGSELSSDSSDEDDLDEATIALIQEVRKVEAKYVAKGIAPDRRKLYKKAINKFNRRPAPRDRPRQKPTVAAVTAGTGVSTTGPPNKLPDSPRKPINELLALANCVRGDCIHCGVTGHMMNNDACPLRGKPLVDRACMRCKKGLHPVDDCLTVFQQQAKPAGAVAQIQECDSDSDLNL
jgi:hypothetical protein